MRLIRSGVISVSDMEHAPKFWHDGSHEDE
jgi:hypothetical protein